jgi:hypothetical protein
MTEIINEVKKALEEATPGTWKYWGTNDIHHITQIIVRTAVEMELYRNLMRKENLVRIGF